MHELSIALGILKIAAEQAEHLGAKRVVSVHLRLGPLSGVVKDALVFSYDLARAGTPLGDARLVVEESPLEGFCQVCQGPRPVVSCHELACASCGAPVGEITSGRELEIVALEIV